MPSMRVAPAARLTAASGDDSKPGLGSRLARSAKLSLRLLCYSSLSLVILGLCYLPDHGLGLGGNQGFVVDIHAKQPVIVPPPRSPWTVLLLLLQTLYIPLTALQLIPDVTRWHLLKVVAVVYLLGIGLAELAGHFATSHLGQVAWLFQPAAYVLAIWLIVPRDSTLPRLVAVWGFVLFVLLGLLVGLFRDVDTSTDGAVVLMVFAVLPLVTEGGNYVCRAVAWEMSTRPGAAGGGRPLLGSRTWPVFLMMQMTGAIIVRLMFTRITEPKLLLATLCFQSAFEVVLRVTMPARDNFLRRHVFSRVPCLAYTSAQGLLVPASVNQATSFDAAKVSHEFVDALEAEKAFNAMALVGAQLAEYVGILLSAAIILGDQGRVLVTGLEYYNAQEDIFTEGIDSWAVLGWAMWQLAFEFLVDVLCTLVEESHGYRLTEVWRGRPRRFWFMTAAAVFSTWVNAAVLAASRDELQACLNRDMCYCFGVSPDGTPNGLESHGLRAKYCLFIYPDTGGRPPNATTPHAL